MIYPLNTLFTRGSCKTFLKSIEIHRAMPVSAIFQCDSSSTQNQLNLSWAGGVLVPVLWAIAWMLEVGAIVNEISCESVSSRTVPGFTKLNLKSDFPMQFFANKIRFVSLVLTTRKICDSQYMSIPFNSAAAVATRWCLLGMQSLPYRASLQRSTSVKDLAMTLTSGSIPGSSFNLECTEF